MKKLVSLKEIKEVRDFLLMSDHLFRSDIIKFVVDAAMKEWRKQQEIGSQWIDDKTRMQDFKIRGVKN